MIEKFYNEKPSDCRLGQWFCIVFEVQDCVLFYGTDDVVTPIIEKYLNDWHY